MQDKLEGLIKMAYRQWKAGLNKAQNSHPDEEALACFIEGRLSPQESERIKEHLISCDACAEAVTLNLKLDTKDAQEVPDDLILRLRDLLTTEDKPAILEVILKLKERALEIINTTGDVLVGQELVPAPVLRSRSIKDFQDEVNILKDFQDTRVELKVENQRGEAFRLTVIVKEKATQKIMKDLRITLLKDNLELESYISDSGKVSFEHVILGKYTVEISNTENKLASVILDIRR